MRVLDGVFSGQYLVRACFALEYGTGPFMFQRAVSVACTLAFTSLTLDI